DRCEVVEQRLAEPEHDAHGAASAPRIGTTRKTKAPEAPENDGRRFSRSNASRSRTIGIAPLAGRALDWKRGITKVSALYAGHIRRENVGLEGAAADERLYPNERLIEPFQTAKEVAQLMDELGYYCLWTAEHHFQREGYEVFPNLILLGTWLAS